MPGKKYICCYNGYLVCDDSKFIQCLNTSTWINAPRKFTGWTIENAVHQAAAMLGREYDTTEFDLELRSANNEAERLSVHVTREPVQYPVLHTKEVHNELYSSWYWDPKYYTYDTILMKPIVIRS